MYLYKIITLHVYLLSVSLYFFENLEIIDFPFLGKSYTCVYTSYVEVFSIQLI